jgi:hypothetical protein
VLRYFAAEKEFSTLGSHRLERGWIRLRGIVNLLAGVRPNTKYVRIANLLSNAIRRRSARHAFPSLEGLGA